MLFCGSRRDFYPLCHRVERVTERVYFVRCDTDESGMNYFIQNMILSYAMHTESFFTPQFLVSHPVYATTVIFI